MHVSGNWPMCVSYPVPETSNTFTAEIGKRELLLGLSRSSNGWLVVFNGIFSTN